MPYTLIEQIDSQHAHIKFDGHFQDIPVTWDTHFFTLKGYISQLNNEHNLSSQFIDIEAFESGIMKLTVALKVTEINPPNIQKMMIMIRQYKNLTIGRHLYG